MFIQQRLKPHCLARLSFLPVETLTPRYLSMCGFTQAGLSPRWAHMQACTFSKTPTQTFILALSYENLSSGFLTKVRKRAKIRNRNNQAPHLTQDNNGKVIISQLDITNESQEAIPSAGDHKASINRRARKHNKYKTEITLMMHKRRTALDRSVKIFYRRA